MDELTLATLDTHLSFFEKLYDVARLVDPLTKIVVDQRGEKNSGSEKCFIYWEDQSICSNCISIRAHQAGKCFMKLVKEESEIVLVTAMPIIDAKKPLVLELLKNATESMMIDMGSCQDGHLMYDYINVINDQIVSDQLTGIYNRRFIDERLPAEVVRSIIEEQPFSVIFMDVDNLKGINDTLGHTAGDEVIRSVANVLSSQIRENIDWVARYGGDEFFVFLHNTPKDMAARIAERIRLKIENLNSAGDLSALVTVSMGIYTHNGEPAEVEEIINIADSRLYKAKQLGKNRYCDE